MERAFGQVVVNKRFPRAFVFFVFVLNLGLALGVYPFAQAAEPQTQTPPASRPVGTLKAIAGNILTLTTDAGAEMSIQVQEGTRFLQVAPGQTDLKTATAIQLTDLQPGDRVLVLGKPSDDGKTFAARAVVAMKKSDIADKQAHEREEWQKHGLGGLVNSVDASTGTITVSLPSVGEKKSVDVHVTKNTVLRRYAVNSIKFDDAKPAPIDQIKAGDQLRARGTRTSDGTELAADEIVSGTFRNIAGTISSIDASAGTVAIQDLLSKKSVIVKVTADSQLRKLPVQMAQGIALRLKGATPDGAQGGANAGANAPAGSTGGSSGQGTRPTGGAAPGGGPGAGSNGAGAGAKRAGGGDFQQMLARMPASTLADLQKGDAVMVVGTEGGADGVSTVITLLGGVEPILEASPKNSPSTILSPWSLSTGGGGEANP